MQKVPSDFVKNLDYSNAVVNEPRFGLMIQEVEEYAIILLDPNGIVSTWNKGAEKIKGYQAQEVIGKTFKLFYSREDKESRLPDTLLEMARTTGKANHEGWRIRKDGTRFWGSITITALHDDERNITGFLKVTRDLTERKTAEDRYSNYTEELKLKNEELRRSEERYHKMVSEVKDYAIILLDKDGKILDWNKGAEKLKGYKAEEILGKTISIFYPPEEKKAKVPEKILEEAILHDSVTREGWRIRKDGTRFWANVTITALRDDSNQIIGYSKVTKDLTERKIADDKLSNTAEELAQKNEELRLSEERYHKMISEVQDYAIILLNNDGIIQNWNAGASLLKGFSSTEIIGKSFKTFYTPEDVQRGLPDSLLQQAREQGKAISEGWRVKKDGSKFWGYVVITALHNEDGQVIGFSKVTRDVTERKIAEDKLWATTLELEAKNKVLESLNEELSSFAYIVSHDLKEPVRKIQVLSARQREEGKTIDQMLELSRKIETTARRMQKLMEDLLSYSELSMDARFEKVALVDMAESAKNDLEVLINEKKALVLVEELPIIRGIPHQLHQLFLNLLSNALKFAKPSESSVIKISSREVKGSQVEGGSTMESKRFFEIQVSDNGIGFDPKHAKKIFEVFHRLQAKSESSGSGIGLAIVKKVMINHSGHVIAESEPNKGTTVKLYFPC
jgi:PAS domain S-box-containing protein